MEVRNTPPHLVEVEELSMEVRNIPTHLVEVEELYMAGHKKKGGRVGPMLIQFLMAYSHQVLGYSSYLQFLMAYGHPHTCGLRTSSQISPTMATS